jgi:hypothetical protein
MLYKKIAVNIGEQLKTKMECIKVQRWERNLVSKILESVVIRPTL